MTERCSRGRPRQDEADKGAAIAATGLVRLALGEGEIRATLQAVPIDGAFSHG